MNFRIIDGAQTPQKGSRGKGLQPRTLELFDDLGLVWEIIASGILLLPIRHYDEDGQFKDEAFYASRAPRPDAPYWSSLLIPQFRVEEKLRERLAVLGAIERSEFLV